MHVLPRPVLDLMARQVDVRKIDHNALPAVAVLAVEPRHADLEAMPEHMGHARTHAKTAAVSSLCGIRSKLAQMHRHVVCRRSHRHGGRRGEDGGLGRGKTSPRG